MKENILIAIGTLGAIVVLVALSNVKTKKLEKKTEECLNDTNDFMKTIDETQQILDDMLNNVDQVKTDLIIDNFYNQYNQLPRDQKKMLWKVN